MLKIYTAILRDNNTHQVRVVVFDSNDHQDAEPEDYASNVLRLGHETLENINEWPVHLDTSITLLDETLIMLEAVEGNQDNDDDLLADAQESVEIARRMLKAIKEVM